jgi:DNA repair protein RAD7
VKLGSKKRKGASDEDEDDDLDDGLGRDMYKKSKKLPGQLENCEICSKRFTVTPYSKAGPDGGLLCTPCGKELAAESKADHKGKKKVLGKKRRKIESDRLDGKLGQGAKTLQQLCIEKVAAHHIDIEEFGDLSQNLLERLSEIFTKMRVLNSRTCKLFLRPDLDTIAFHDAACIYPAPLVIQSQLC